MKELGYGVVAIVILIFMLAVLFAGQTCNGRIGGVSWSVTVPAIHLPSPPAPSPSPSGAGT